jgi:hypothetical protein
VTVERPAGVKAIAGAFILAAAYLLTVGLITLARPGLLSMRTGTQLLGGFALAGPYAFLLTAFLSAVVALGLWQLDNWARWMAILIAVAGIVMLVPSVSSAVVFFRFGRLAWGAAGVMLRTMIVWYLFQEPVRDLFRPSLNI